MTTVLETIKKNAKLDTFFDKMNVRILVTPTGIEAKYYKGHPTCPLIEIIEHFNGVSLSEAKEIVKEVKIAQNNQYMKASLHFSKEVAKEVLTSLNCYELTINDSCSFLTVLRFKKVVEEQECSVEFYLSSSDQSFPFTFNSYGAFDDHDSLNKLIKHYMWAMSPANPFN